MVARCDVVVNIHARIPCLLFDWLIDRYHTVQHRQQAAGDWWLVIGDWRLAIGDWRMVTGD
ncbi:hypothetical protein D3C77_767450 [compost metagenome]